MWSTRSERLLLRACVRALSLPDMRDLYERVVNIAPGAELMTGTELRIEFDGACAEYVLNTTLENVLHRHVEELGPVPFSAEDQATARQFLDLNLEAEVALRRERSGMARTISAACIRIRLR
jgi:aminobenzoyl-glutamate utilization protein B